MFAARVLEGVDVTFTRILLIETWFARGPAIILAGSDGITCDNVKVMTESPKRTTMRKSILRTISLVIM